MHKNTLDLNNTVLLVIDIQEKIKSAMLNIEKVIENTSRLIKAANILEIPVIYTEQYPKGLGKTVESLKVLLDNAKGFEKVGFSCCIDTEFCNYLKSLNRKQVIICGIESHVCVCQTVHDLLADNYAPHIISDAVSSRAEENYKVALNKMNRSGAVISSVEIALFELIRGSNHPNFKEVQKLIM